MDQKAVVFLIVPYGSSNPASDSRRSSIGFRGGVHQVAQAREARDLKLV
jgi:hypothetical protein